MSCPCPRCTQAEMFDGFWGFNKTPPSDPPEPADKLEKLDLALQELERFGAPMSVRELIEEVYNELLTEEENK